MPPQSKQPQRHAPVSAPVQRRGAYNPDTSRRISRLPPYMEIILESERHKAMLEQVAKRQPHGLVHQLSRASGPQQQQDSSQASQAGPNPDDLVAEGKALCLEYVNHRLRRSGALTQRQLDALGPPAEYSEVGEELRLVGEELETMYPDLFNNVHRQLNLAMHSEEVSRRTFVMFCDQLCRDSIHWGKVVALFAMAGAFAADCASQGHLDYAQKIVDAFGAFVATRLCTWLTEQGGWIIPDVTRCNQTSGDQTATWIFASFAALAVLTACVLLLLLL
uniref:BCL domain-containing protein n=1 Tax=Macrostomum lignano TaxID=282301 RepID=A0A1I8H8A7_9PLAT